jgi:hypothetical protein
MKKEQVLVLPKILLIKNQYFLKLFKDDLQNPDENRHRVPYRNSLPSSATLITCLLKTEKTLLRRYLQMLEM